MATLNKIMPAFCFFPAATSKQGKDRKEERREDTYITYTVYTQDSVCVCVTEESSFWVAPRKSAHRPPHPLVSFSTSPSQSLSDRKPAEGLG
jgi:hypothetical protein